MISYFLSEGLPNLSHSCYLGKRAKKKKISSLLVIILKAPEAPFAGGSECLRLQVTISTRCHQTTCNIPVDVLCIFKQLKIFKHHYSVFFGVTQSIQILKN